MKFLVSVGIGAVIAAGVFFLVVEGWREDADHATSQPPRESRVPQTGVGAADVVPAAPPPQDAVREPVPSQARAPSNPSKSRASAPNSVPVAQTHLLLLSDADAQPTLLMKMHSKLEGESRDDAWSYPMEYELQNYVSLDGKAKGFQLQHLECRYTLCEMQLTGPDASQDLDRFLSGLRAQPWSHELTIVGTGATGIPARKQLAIVLLLERTRH